MGWSRTLTAFLAAAQLALPDRRAMALLDLSEPGFWHSFQALFWHVGALALATAFGAPPPEATGLPVTAASQIVVDALFDTADFLAFPLLMIPVTRSLGLGTGYAALVIATNWASALAAILVSTVALGPPMPQLVWDLVVVGLLAYQWNAIRIALGVGGLMAAGITALGVVLTLLLHQVQTLATG